MFDFEPLRETCKRMGITPNKLRRDNVLNAQTMTKVNKDMNVTVETVAKICRHLKVPIEQVVRIHLDD